MSIAIPEWEYKIINVAETPHIDNFLNQEGSMGWELVSVTSHTTVVGRYFFKRQSGLRVVTSE